jgi:hypothetical protein
MKTERHINNPVLEQTFIFTSARHVQLNTCRTFRHYLLFLCFKLSNIKDKRQHRHNLIGARGVILAAPKSTSFHNIHN